MNLEQILNYAIPIGFFLLIFGIIFSKSKEPIIAFFSWIGSGLKGLFGVAKHAGNVTKEITYDEF